MENVYVSRYYSKITVTKAKYILFLCTIFIFIHLLFMLMKWFLRKIFANRVTQSEKKPPLSLFLENAIVVTPQKQDGVPLTDNWM